MYCKYELKITRTRTSQQRQWLCWHLMVTSGWNNAHTWK